MLAYEELVSGLEQAWTAAGLHEHTLIESIQPATHDRSYRVDLFPEHAEPLSEETMPPWVEINFTWSAAHQLRSEGRDIETESLFLSWNYVVLVPMTQIDEHDRDLVRLFQRAVAAALRRFYPNEAEEMSRVAVEVRRYHQFDGQQMRPVYAQLASTNITDLSDMWDDADPASLRRLLRAEIQLASAVIQALRDVFLPQQGGNGNYRAVDTA